LEVEGGIEESGGGEALYAQKLGIKTRRRLTLTIILVKRIFTATAYGVGSMTRAQQ